MKKHGNVGKVPWNKGYTKDTHPSVLNISHTLASKPRSNFYEWQQKNKVTYPNFKKNVALAELYGTILGDGCIEILPRTEKITISFNFKEKKHIEHVKKLLKQIFQKEPKIRHRKTCKCTDVYIYQKYISERLNFPSGIKLNHDLRIPKWIKNNHRHLLVCLKGLFETDGCWTIDKSNYTSVISFRNNLQGLLDDVFTALVKLGFHPQRRKLDVRLARKKEVKEFADLISFRKY